MRGKVLILVEGHRGNGPLHIQAAQRLGLHPITLAVDPAQYEYVAAEAADAVLVDTSDIDALIRECYRLRIIYDIAGITGFAHDDASVSATVGKLCRHFGLPGPNPVSIEQCYDKFTQRQLLSEADVSVPAYHIAANGMEAESCANDIGMPVVIKLALGGGSTRARLCRNVEELSAHTAELFGVKHTARRSTRILIEEFTRGPQYSINMIGNEVIGIAALEFCQGPEFVCRECTYPAVLTEKEHEAISAISLNCLRALGLGWGPTDIELRLTKHGPVVIGVSPHLPASPAPELVQLAYGVDLITEHIKLVTRAQRSLRRSPTDTAAARFLIPDCDGTLDWVDGRTRAAAVSGVSEVEWYIEPKARIARKGNCRDRIGHVIAVSTTHAQTRIILQRAADLIDWSITPSSNLGE
ncbi:ATP-grasp domain-containing protein [Mesorhizobium sp.]|uniref:ATP-grasp domain-containing protein n=1 Tax=Mesorhizobium sp. TaxID=1871066 RepID=UPI001209512E|nr:ATP-grasp domain-containing protein [Mesorhizobium sp.]TIN74986.1 MAG: ATP-grasp domain-containing protein [Mesorhizobium sp.]TIO64314.1 MAG: ATP-grasp domain-containing protein [Mesorhizobium sp.]TIS29595.1 MAG: ATP-grasp domain-containing protein [Mesorhizobium sp.]TJV88654.1 MAG: ATP-grasp domain-containing protein [Mesorhizobium sp.]